MADLLPDVVNKTSGGGTDLLPDIVNFKPKRFLERTDRQGMPGVATDVGEGVFDFITGIPGMIETGGKAAGYGAAQAQTKPKRFMQNVGGAIGEYGSQVGNLPQAALEYSKSRNLIRNPTRRAEDEALLQQLQSFNKPRPRTPDENFFQRVGRSIHLPKPGTFDYAKELGLSNPSFKKEAEADALAKQVIPTLLASPGGAPGIAAQTFGSEENPFGVLAVPLAPKALKEGARKITPDWLTKERAGKTVGESAKALKNKFEYKYNEIRERAAEENIVANIPRHTFKEIKDTYPGIPDDTIRLVDKAYRTGDFNDLHKADVQLGKDKQYKFKDKTGQIIKQDAFDSATKLEDRIQEHMEKALEKHSPELAKEWFKNKETYAKELGPFLDIPAIREYVKGDLTASDLTRLLQSNTKSGKLFRARLASEYKAIGRNALKNKLVKLGIKGGLIGKFLSIASGA